MENKVIKVCTFDLDGTLTDGTCQVSNSGTITKSFYAKDFYGLFLLIELGVDVYILTGSEDNCIYEQIALLPKKFREGIKCYSSSGIGKRKFIESFVFASSKVGFDNIAYMGDDENDLECMCLSGITGCPDDAVKKVKDESNFIADKSGGRGAARDFVEYLIEHLLVLPSLLVQFYKSRHAYILPKRFASF